MSEAFRWYPVFSMTAASLANYSIRVWMCVRVHAHVRSVSTKEEANRRFHQKHQNTKSVCVYVCCASCAHFDDWRNLHQHLSMECICVCARACRVCLCGVFACDCINMVSEWWDVPSIHLFCWHLHLKRATIEERQIGEMQESEISSAVTRFCNIVGFCCTLFRVNTHSWVTCNSSLVPFWNHLLTRLRVSKYLREAVYEWSYGVSSCGCGCFVFCFLVCMCVFVWVYACTRDRERTHCSHPPYLSSQPRARAVSPLSDMTRLWYRTPSSPQITDHPKNTHLSTNLLTSPLFASPLLARSILRSLPGQELASARLKYLWALPRVTEVF